MILFFDRDDTSTFLDAPSLMQAARDMLASSNLIGGCSIGLRIYIEAYFRGFWPFVFQLEKIVDDRPLPREPLNIAAGNKHEATRKLIAITRAREQVVKQEGESLGWLSTRKATHAEYWREDAGKRGIELLAAPVSGVLQLIDAFKKAGTPAEFFACLVAGEMVALGLGEELGGSTAFNARGRSLWIDAHLVKPEVSALDINMSFLRAYAMTADPNHLKQSVLRVIGLFGSAADSVVDDLL